MSRTIPIALGFALAAGAAAAEPAEVAVFDRAPIHFAPGVADPPGGIRVEDSGRTIRRLVPLPDPGGPHRITATLVLEPVPQDDLSVHDPWDRAGNVTLHLPDRPPLELLKFVTSYGGRTEHSADVTHLAALLRGRCEIGAFIDTWLTPAWLATVTIRFEPDENAEPAIWAAPVFLEASYNAEDTPEGVQADVRIPAGLERVVLRYYTSGHCTDGRDEDEFVSKPNVIAVDGVVVRRFHPWRDDCRGFRQINPYTKRWSDGTWSSDYSRSGWCPGRSVPPEEIDLTDHLTPGAHRMTFRVENVRPRGEDGHFGYWRLSGHLVGWDHAPDLWKNP